MSHFLQILIFLPVVGAIIGFVCKWVAIKMLFHPRTWVGLGPIGWQGVVQRHAPKFSAGVADTVATSGLTVDAMLERVAPDELVTAIGPKLDEHGPELVEAVLEQARPGFWATLPEPMRALMVAQLGQENRRIARALVVALRRVLRETFDVKSLVVKRLSGPNADRLAALMQHVAARELRIVIWYGAVLGFFIGLVEVAGYTALERWWLLPIIGAVDGLVNNWFAIQMIFRPYERTRYFWIFPYQGLFPARQGEIASQYAEMLAKDVLSPGEILAHATELAGPRLVATAVATVEAEVEPLLPMLSMALGAPLGPEERTRVVAAVMAKLTALAPSVQPHLERTLHERLGVATSIEGALGVMTKAEFEKVLRGIFEEEEWILIALGGFLGGLIGLGQAAIVLAFGS
ncbi:MAG: DUF445 family protein [Polyangiaceae bacterium]|nr:DUF445 family protein [Polyangiaceae bacterium]